MQTAGNLVVRAVELAAGVQNRKNDLDRRLALGRMHIDGDAAAVVADGERTVFVDDDVDHRTVPCQSLVDGVVHHLVDQMVVSPFAGVADIHRRALAHGLHSFENLNVFGVVIALF